MSTATTTSSPAQQLRAAVDHVRWAPAPAWGPGATAKARFVTYVTVSMLAWTGLGLGASAALGQLVALAG